MNLLPDQRDLALAAMGTLALVTLAFGHRPPQIGGDVAGKTPIRLAYFPNLTHAPALVGVARGDFDRALDGYTVSTRVVNAGPEAMEALLAGEVDLSYVGPSPAVNTFIKSKGKALRIISGACSGGASLIARAGTGIARIEDLANRRVAVPQLGGTQDVSLRHFLSTKGLLPREQRGTVEIIPAKNPDILTLFKQGQIDAAWVPEPWATRLRTETKATLVVDERDLWPGGKFTTTVLVARTAFAEKHPDAVAQFLGAHRQVVAWIRTHPDAAQDSVNGELKRLTGKRLPDLVLRDSWSRLEFTTDANAPAVQAMADAARDAGYSKGPQMSLVGLFAAPEAVAKR